MTKEELIKLIEPFPNNIHIAIRAKDDFLLMEDMVYTDLPYFGNCSNGTELQDEMCYDEESDEINYEKTPAFIIFDSGRN
jgi:hypothetical protein